MLEPVPDAAGGGGRPLVLPGAPRQVEAVGVGRERPSSPRSTSPPRKVLMDVDVVAVVRARLDYVLPARRR